MLIVPTRAFATTFLQHYSQSWNTYLHVSRADPRRLKTLRASSLPFCPLDFFYNVSMKGMSRSLDMGGLYYTTVGTAVHTVMQTALAQDGHRLWGNWKCRACNTVRMYSVYRPCSCGGLPEYEELEVDYKGLVGHVDTLFCLEPEVAAKISKKRHAKTRLRLAQEHLSFVIVDYKTSSLSGAPQKSRSPGAAYIEQLESYAWTCTKQYKLNIKAIMNVFIPRDNPDPRRITIFERPVDSQMIKRSGERVKRYKAARTDATKVETKKQLLTLLKEHGRCSNQYCQVCKTPDPKAVLLQAYKMGRANDRLPLKTFIDKALERP